MLYHSGPSPTVMDYLSTVFVVVSITETVPSPMLVTYILLFTGSYAISSGPSPTVIGLPITVFVVVSITETVSSQR